MAFRMVAGEGDIPPGEMIEVEVDGQTIVICNAGGVLHAMDGLCPHARGPLAQGALHGTIVVCPWHAWEFDCVTGAYDRTGTLRQRKFDVKVEGGRVLVDAG